MRESRKGTALDLGQLQFNHTTELHTYTQSYSDLWWLPRLLHPRSPCSILPCHPAPRLAALDSQSEHCSSGKDWAFLQLGLKCLNFTDNNVNNSIIDALYYIYVAPEPVAVFVLFFKLAQEVSLTHFSIFSGEQGRRATRAGTGSISRLLKVQEAKP